MLTLCFILCLPTVLPLPVLLLVMTDDLIFFEDEEGFVVIGSEEPLAFVEAAAVTTLFVVVDATFLVSAECTVGRAVAVKNGNRFS